MRPRRLLVTSCAVAALTLSACSDGPPAADDLTWEDSPLQEALAGVFGDEGSPEDWEQEEAERNRQVEEIVATCMADEGFEYTPVDTSATSISYSEDEDWDTDEWAQQYGYGITTDPWADEVSAEPVGEEWVDPNEDYVSVMSPAEQEAYYEALYGVQEEIVEDDGEWVEDETVEYSWEESGCQGRAYHEVYEEDQGYEAMMEDPSFAELFESAEGIYEEAERDPRVTEIRAEWAQCMADGAIAGLTSPEDAYASISEEYDRMYSEADEQIDWEAIDWDALEASGTGDPVRELMDEDALTALREREIATAVADRACTDEHDIESRVLAVQFEHEEEFVKTFQAEIDALVATYGQGS